MATANHANRQEIYRVNPGCNFGMLEKLIDNQLELDKKLKVLFHLDTCDICRDVVYQITYDRDEARYNAIPQGKNQFAACFGSAAKKAS